MTLRIGILNDSAQVPSHVDDLVAWIQGRPDMEATHLVLCRPPQRGPFQRLRAVARRDGPYVAISKAVFRCVVALERLSLRAFGRWRPSGSRDVSARISAVLELAPQVSQSGFVYRFGAADLDRLRACRLDLLIRCGSGILRGDILKVPRLGILSFHHADNRINRGGPPGFWEVYLRQDTTGFTIQRLTEALDGGDVLMRGHLPTRFIYSWNHAELLRRSNHHLQNLLRRVAASGSLPVPQPAQPYAGPLFRTPLAHQSAAYLLRVAARLAAKAFRRLRPIEWRTAFVPGRWDHAVLYRGIELLPPQRHFLADPFVIDRDGETWCFVEDYDHRAGRAAISVYRLSGTRAHRVGTALAEPFHLSFPFLFEFDGGLYLCPETSAARDIRVYRCVEFPLRWERAATLMKGVSAADSLLFERNGRWWLLTNVDPLASGEHCSELHAFSAETPLSQDWLPHPGNPVIVDAACARNGGLILDQGRLIRVAQGHGFDLYGKYVSLNEIVEISDDSYAERRIAMLAPEFGRGAVGIHHLHGSAAYTVFDYFSPRADLYSRSRAKEPDASERRDVEK